MSGMIQSAQKMEIEYILSVWIESNDRSIEFSELLDGHKGTFGILEMRPEKTFICFGVFIKFA
jgi:hypothetical protein